MFGKPLKTPREVVQDIANGIEYLNIKYCIEKNNEFCLARQLKGSIEYIPYPIRTAFGRLSDQVVYNPKLTKLNISKPRPIYDKGFKVLSLKREGNSYTFNFYPGTILERIEGDPAKYKIEFETGEINEVSECAIVPSKEYWGNEQHHYKIENQIDKSTSNETNESNKTKKTKESKELESDSSNSSYSDSESESSSNTYSSSSDDESSTSTYSSSSSSSLNSSDDESKYRHHSSHRRRRKHNTIIIPIIIPIPLYQNQYQYQQLYQQPFFPQNQYSQNYSPKSITHKKHKHH